MSTCCAMNYKNLNYEIETYNGADFGFIFAYTMNYKNLNYEIETLMGAGWSFTHLYYEL